MSIYRIVLVSFVLSNVALSDALISEPRPTFLTFDELVKLSETARPSAELQHKLHRVLETPFVETEMTPKNVRPHRPSVEGLGPVLRVVSWNIERGINFDLIRLAFSDPAGFKKAIRERIGFDPEDSAKLDRQLQLLRNADILLLNEVDLGIKRTEYRDVARELAQGLGMNYAFGVEFVEVDRLEDLGVEKVELGDARLNQEMQEELKTDPGRYKGLHGNAILSRYPLENVRIIRLPVCHDWYAAEKAEISRMEKGKRLAADKIFLERFQREVRQGGRMALVADAKIPDLPGGKATAVSVHLESKCKPSCRARQMDALLAQLRDIGQPVIVGGDLNTTGTDGSPTSIRREILNRVKNYEFWVMQALNWGTPASVPLAALAPVKYFKNYHDPSSRNIPIFAGNKEAKLFRHAERFRFTDHGAFDFRGEPDRNLHAKGRTLANSNQRAFKGFEPTFSLKRDFGGIIGRYKLDWFFIKPFITNSRGDNMSYQFAPHFPVTLRDLNSLLPDGISDHAPISVDLPLTEQFAASESLALKQSNDVPTPSRRSRATAIGR